jgi:hypothetical protein
VRLTRWSEFSAVRYDRSVGGISWQILFWLLVFDIYGKCCLLTVNHHQLHRVAYSCESLVSDIFGYNRDTSIGSVATMRRRIITLTTSRVSSQAGTTLSKIGTTTCSRITRSSKRFMHESFRRVGGTLKLEWSSSTRR